MEIGRLEVSTQQHLERMQETEKVNYVQYGKSPKVRRVRNPHSLVQVQTARGVIGAMEQVLNPVERVGSFHSSKDTCYTCGKGRHQKVQDCKAVDVVCRGCGKKGHFEKVCLKGKCSTHFQHQHCRGRGQ